jgi:hypothetical protein
MRVSASRPTLADQLARQPHAAAAPTYLVFFRHPDPDPQHVTTGFLASRLTQEDLWVFWRALAEEALADRGPEGLEELLLLFLAAVHDTRAAADAQRYTVAESLVVTTDPSAATEPPTALE